MEKLLMLNEVYLGLGSNMGDRHSNMRRAVGLISSFADNNLTVSNTYETYPQGFRSQPPFINAACKLWTNLDPFEMMVVLFEIQFSMGVTAPLLNGPRPLDIDILMYGNLVINAPNLVLPHPRMHERKFVLEPLTEIAPFLTHPILKLTVTELLSQLEGETGIRGCFEN
jgi:2-amino-4-hydroxy-6-hydroxymethyldihydropteridine diphosphokinase